MAVVRSVGARSQQLRGFGAYRGGEVRRIGWAAARGRRIGWAAARGQHCGGDERAATAHAGHGDTRSARDRGARGELERLGAGGESRDDEEPKHHVFDWRSRVKMSELFRFTEMSIKLSIHYF